MFLQLWLLFFFLHFQKTAIHSRMSHSTDFLLFIYFSPISLPDLILSLTSFLSTSFQISKRQTLGHSQVWAIGLGQEGVVRVEVVRRHSSSFIFSFQVWLKMQPLYVWVFFYDAQVCITLFSQMTNYEYAHLGIVYEFILATKEILHAEARLHECPTFEMMQTTKLVHKKQ